MTAIDPRSVNEVYESVKENLQNKIPKLTNFIETSFNYVFVNAYAEAQHEAEVAATAAQLSGWVDYVGKTITPDDVDDLGIDGATADELNAFIDETDLDEFAKVFGVARDSAVASTGTVTFTTNTGITIPQGTSVGTQPDSDGDFIEYETVEAVSIESSGTVDAQIQATITGSSGNVGSGTLTYLPAPPTGVDSVTNNNPTTGGADQQTTASLRDEVKNAVVSSSQGGTTNGVETFILNNTDASSVSVQEFFQGDTEHGSYPHADVIVYGDTDQAIQDAIDTSHPSGVEHILVRPDIVEFNVEVDAEGTNINTSVIENEIEEYLDELDLGQEVYRDKIIQVALNADPDIDNLDRVIIEILNEEHEFTGELIDDFEDQDITVNDSDWTGWSGDTSNFSAQNGVVIDQNYSGQLSSSNEAVSIAATRSSENASDGLSFGIHIDDQTANTNDFTRVLLFDGSTRLGYIVFDGDGDAFWFDGSDVSLGTWQPDTDYSISLVIDYDVSPNTATIFFDGSSTEVNLENDVSGIDTFQLSVDTTASGSSVNAYIDTIQLYDTVYQLDKELEPVDSPADTGVVSLTGTLLGSTGHTFVEDTDFQEYNSASEDTTVPQDSVNWGIGGNIPDVGTTFSVTYYVEEDIDIQPDEVAQLNTVTASIV